MAVVDLNLDIDQGQQIASDILRGRMSAMTVEEIINEEYSTWVASEKRKWMLTGEKYYKNKTKILEHKREVIGEGGARVEVTNLANNKLANAFTRKLVDQKTGYLLGKPLTIQTENAKYLEILNQIFDKAMMRRFKSLGKEAINKGIAWLHVYYDENGALSFKKMRSEEIIPLWRDEAHTVLDAIIRVYEVEVYEGKNQKTIKKYEWWDTQGVRRYTDSSAGLVLDVEAGDIGGHFTVVTGGREVPMTWNRVPFIPFKYNEEEQPLIEIIKNLVDDYDRNKSDNSNNLEDLPNSIYVVKNYTGTDPGEFRKNISIYRTVFVSDDGGLDSVGIEIDTEAYKTHMDMARKDIYEFGRGVLFDPGKFGSNPSGIALRFMYEDLDLDMSLMETEFQASLEQLRWFIDAHIYSTTQADYSEEEVEFIFNKDMPVEEDSIIMNIRNSEGLLSEETRVAQHPWVNDVAAELERKRKEQERELEELDTFRFGEKVEEMQGRSET